MGPDDGVWRVSRKPASQEASSPGRRALWLALLAAGLVLIAVAAVGCGESDEEKAQTQVCDARDDLKTQVDDLAALTPATATVDGVQEDLDAIEDDLNQIKDAQGDLNEDRRQEVESATQQFAPKSRQSQTASHRTSHSVAHRPSWRPQPSSWQAPTSRPSRRSTATDAQESQALRRAERSGRAGRHSQRLAIAHRRRDVHLDRLPGLDGDG